MSTADKHSLRAYELWLSVTQVTDPYLNDEARITPGTGTAFPQSAKPLPSLVPGEPLYDTVKAWITLAWGDDARMPPEGKRLWYLLLGASRRGEGSKTERSQQWAKWLVSAQATAPNAATQRPAPPEDRFFEFTVKQRSLLMALRGKGKVPIDDVLKAVYGARGRDKLDALLKLKDRSNKALSQKRPAFEIKKEGETLALVPVS
jgi:hypothetical protein